MDYEPRAAAAKPVTFSFPVLKPQDILMCMSDLNIALTEEELAKPTPARALAIYEALLDLFMGCSRDGAHSSPVSRSAGGLAFAVTQLDHPELHQDSMAFMAAYRQLARLLTRIGIDDFSVRDLVRPEAPRMRRILSAMINLAKYREEKFPLYEQCSQQSADLAAERQRLEQQIAAANDQLATLRAQIAAKEPEMKRVRDLNTDILADLRSMKRTQSQRDSEIDALRKQKSDAMALLSATETQLVATKAECDRLEGRIVRNPDQLKQTIETMRTTTEHHRTALAALETKSWQLSGKMARMDDAVATLSACLRNLQEAVSEHDRAQAAQEAVTGATEARTRRQMALREAQITGAQIQRQLANLADKRARLAKYQEGKQQALDARLHALEREYAQTADDRAARAQAIATHEQAVLQLEAEIAAVRLRLHEDTAALHQDEAALRDRLQTYQRHVADEMAKLDVIREAQVASERRAQKHACILADRGAGDGTEPGAGDEDEDTAVRTPRRPAAHSTMMDTLMTDSDDHVPGEVSLPAALAA
ncbi:hypothetical protein CXG81DRAFT_16500 [Caulochytrium protostelioides]|uniref:Uncharacterized protein n=1 Tax=Caulochytrium protostelioides TaxID=1555241 RepID=A0A4P9XEU8_9FUNG|nr:hypothetical protein CXG81DRAFT_16500 [Caulochytrium protostelioides]|eukprot:RKP04074.1 hypothetical protein CXG81DRAFT_16500 [Caulochytrium protostelioides]